MSRTKRLAAPRTWSLARKTHKWAVTASPGPHSRAESVPLVVILRDMLHICDTAKEGERIIHSRKVLVDGRVVTDPRYPVGFMDVLAIPEVKGYHRMVIDRRGKLRLVKVDEGAAAWKLSRVEDKTIVPDGRVQLNLSDGRNLLVEKDEYHTADTLKIAIPDQRILEVIPFEKGNVALLRGGQHVGELGHLEEEKVERSAKPNVIHFREGFNTVKPYVFIVGRKEPQISLPEVRAI